MSDDSYHGPVAIRKGNFGRWYIFHPTSNRLAWSGSRFVQCTPAGLPTGGVQVCNFDNEEQARFYWNERGGSHE